MRNPQAVSEPASAGVATTPERPYEIALFGRGARQSPHHQAGIWLVDRDGVSTRLICEVCGWAELDWAPDGASVVFIENDFNCQGGMFRLDLAEPQAAMAVGLPGREPVRMLGSEGRLVAETGPFGYLSGTRWDRVDAPRWSPAGDEVAVIVSGPRLRTPGDAVGAPFHAVAVKDPFDEEAPLRPIYHASATSIQQIAWSPDGSRLALLVHHADCGEDSQCLEIVDRRSGLLVERWRLADLGVPSGLHSGLDWAPTAPPGRREPVFAIGGAGVELGERRKAFHLYVVEPRNDERPSELVCSGRRPAWSPDGRSLLYESTPRGGGAFGQPCRIDLATGATRKLQGFWWVQGLAWKRPVEAIDPQVN